MLFRLLRLPNKFDLLQNHVITLLMFGPSYSTWSLHANILHVYWHIWKQNLDPLWSSSFAFVRKPCEERKDVKKDENVKAKQPTILKMKH